MYSSSSGMLGESLKRLQALYGLPAEHFVDMGESPEHVFSYEGSSSLLNQIAVKAVEVLKVSHCQILVLAQGGTFRCQASHGLVKTGITRAAGLRDHLGTQELLQRAILSDAPTFIDQRIVKLSHEQLAVLHASPQENLLLFPMRIDTEPVGILTLGFDSHTYLAERMNQAFYLADQAAKVLHRESLPFSDEESIVEIVMALSKALEARDLSTGEHCRQITRLTERIAIDLGCSFHEVQAVRRAALLHDIGKIGIPDNILHKPGLLNEHEWMIMKQHPEIGARILRMIAGLSDVARLVLAHHERYDGSGYPLGLKGDEIPMGARILAVVDAFGSMITNRVYRPARTMEDAIDELHRCSGKDFDPVVVESFTRLIEFPI